MPDIYLHSRLTEDVIKDLNRDINQNIAFLGAQGPDPMYYNNFNKNQAQFRYYADRIHDTNTQDFFIDMVNYVKTNNNQSTYSFLIGFICHYALDSSLHPYVYSNVGIFKKDDPKTHNWRGLHLKFERTIDCLLIEEETGIKAGNFNLLKKHYPLKHSNKEINGLMDYVLNRKFNIENGYYVYKSSVTAMYKIIKYMYRDPFSIKRVFYKFIDLFTKNLDMHMVDLSFNRNVHDFDYHNKEKRNWNHPVTNEQYNYSVMEIYDQAKDFALGIISKVNEYLLNSKDIDLTSVFTNLSFNSGLDCDQKKPFQYFNVYRK